MLDPSEEVTNTVKNGLQVFESNEEDLDKIMKVSLAINKMAYIMARETLLNWTTVRESYPEDVRQKLDEYYDSVLIETDEEENVE